MRFLLLLLLFYFNLTISAFCQKESEYNKPSIDTSVFETWPYVVQPVVSNDGNYFSYCIYGKPVGGHTLVLKSTRNDWKLEFVGAQSGNFTSDNKHFICLTKNDSLCLVKLSDYSITYTQKISFYKLYKRKHVEWLVYRTNSEDRAVVFINLADNRKYEVNRVFDYWISGNHVIIKTEIDNGNSNQGLSYLNLGNPEPLPFFVGQNIENIIFDLKGDQVAFMAGTKVDNKSLWHYIFGTQSANLISVNKHISLDSNLLINRIISFSSDGSRLFLKLMKNDDKINKSKSVSLDIWSYKDKKLQSQQLNELNNKELNANIYTAVLQIKSHEIIRLQHTNEDINLFIKDGIEDFSVITQTNGGDLNEWFWNPASYPSFFLQSTVTGKRVKLNINYPYQLSPNGRYLIGTDSYIRGVTNNVMSYELKTGNSYNITKSLGVPKNDSKVSTYYSLSHRGFTVLGWLPNDSAILVADNYDIWKLDPIGKKAPTNLTKFFGRRNKIKFGILNLNGKEIIDDEYILLSAFDFKSKNNGFFSLKLKGKGELENLSMGPYVYSINLANSFYRKFTPLHAPDTNIYIVRRESVFESPNYYLTTDFKTFRLLSDVFPEKNYNWLKSKLYNFRTLDGNIEQGVLYYPENFNSMRKYPMIIHYYQSMSDRLNEYKKPEACSDNINIPWFVSQGYLVFTPDINYKIGEPGKSAYNSIVAAAKFMRKFSWVDSAKMGIQGHSWGGYQTNYLVTHTDLFSAAISSAGVSDFISGYGAVGADGLSRQYFYEVHQSRIGVMLWKNPKSYIQNSPIFSAHKIKTPILLINNKADGGVPFTQGIEFFSAMRRLGKRAWLLQYDGEGHSILNDNAKMDYTLRMTQFFNHFLKLMPAPIWISNGIEAKYKGVIDGFEIENKTLVK